MTISWYFILLFLEITISYLDVQHKYLFSSCCLVYVDFYLKIVYNIVNLVCVPSSLFWTKNFLIMFVHFRLKKRMYLNSIRCSDHVFEYFMCHVLLPGHPYHADGLTCLTISSDSTLAITGAKDSSVHVVNIASGKVQTPCFKSLNFQLVLWKVFYSIKKLYINAFCARLWALFAITRIPLNVWGLPRGKTCAAKLCPPSCCFYLLFI